MAVSEHVPVVARLAKVQQELKAPKGQYNSYGKYKYRSCEDILEAVKPLLKKQGLTLIIYDEIHETACGWVYVKAVAAVRPVDGSEGEVSVSAYARESDRKGMDSAQATGSSSSYARKYALNGLFLIDDARDPDVTNTHGKKKHPADSGDTPF